MKKRILKIISLLTFMSLFLCSFPFFAFSESPIYPSKKEVSSALLYHVETDELLDFKEKDLVLPAGSTVKLLSGLLFCELSEGKRNETVRVEKSMINGITGHRIGLEAGITLSVNDLLIMALCGSYNDAFSVLACHYAGSISEFAVLMNQRAAEIGCKNSTFFHPIGIDDTSLTTASDLLKIAKVAYENDFYMQFTSIPEYRLSFANVKNHNELIFSTTTNAFHNSLCSGMTAGNTTKAGSCVITAAENNGQHFLSVVLGGLTTNDASVDYGYLVTNRMIEWCCKYFSFQKVITEGDRITTIPVTVSDITDEIPLIAKDSLSAFLPKAVDVKKDIVYSIRLDCDSLEAPVEEGTCVGTVAAVYQGKVLGCVRIITGQSVERSPLIGFLQSIKNVTDRRRVRAGGIFFLTVLSAWIVSEIVIKRKKHKKWETYFDGNQ